MKRERLLELMADKKITSVSFVKRSDGSLRKMVCRLGVTCALKGGTKAFDDVEKNLITVFDMSARQYRSVPCENVVQVVKKGIIYTD